MASESDLGFWGEHPPSTPAQSPSWWKEKIGELDTVEAVRSALVEKPLLSLNRSGQFQNKWGRVLLSGPCVANRADDNGEGGCSY